MTNIIKCLFLPVGCTNIKASQTLSNYLKREYGIENKIHNEFIFNKKFIILGTQNQLTLSITSVCNINNRDKKKMFTDKETDLIKFLSDNIYYGLIDIDKNNSILGKFPFKKTSYYAAFFSWLKIKNKKLRRFKT